MTIDHASREPDDPPPVGGGPAYDLRPMVAAEVMLHGGQRTNTLTSASFAEIVRIKFDLDAAPNAAWCRKVLRDLPYLVEYPGDYYRLQG